MKYRFFSGSLAVLLIAALMLSLWGCGPKQEKPLVGIAWRADTTASSCVNTFRCIEAAGGTPVLLDQVMARKPSYDEKGRLVNAADAVGALSTEAAEAVKEGSWQDSNAKKVMKGISAVVFTGGEDISPSLYRVPESWHGIFEEINYNASRDVSDYLLMAYCLDNDVPVLGICRGMQMMAVAGGADMIQDIPSYFASLGRSYDHTHRYVPGTPEPERDYVTHDVVVKEESLAFSVTGLSTLTGCPSLHHQAVKDVVDSGFIVSGTAQVSGEDMIEMIEHPGMRFCLGLQFHPEAALDREGKEGFMSEETALTFFSGLIDAIQ
ncbi:MAG: gamma-glutamyl-gamma-aminobutyrate hydrolase family protein [Oscillospiraceae bacterium]|nr:gamma-glutamyl-gamma-aminobutyrate hydrolase family protein [Oscillospiraceae bacterium]